MKHYITWLLIIIAAVGAAPSRADDRDATDLNYTYEDGVLFPIELGILYGLDVGDELAAINLVDALGLQAVALIEELGIARTEAAIIHCRPNIDQGWASELAGLIYFEANANALDPLFCVAVCFKESSFNPNATNPTTRCAGLFQLHPMHKIANVYEPAVNVRWGCLKLRKYIDERGGDLRRGLHRYGHDDRGARATLALYEKLKEATDAK